MSTTPPPDSSSQESLSTGPIERYKRVAITIYPENCSERDDAKSEQDSSQASDCISPENAVQSSVDDGRDNISIDIPDGSDEIKDREDNVQSKREIIANTFYTEVSDFIKDEGEYTISCCEKFTDTCCQSVTCSCPL